MDFERDRRKKLGEGPWYSINSDVYHDNPHCNTGTSIEPKNILRGTGDKRLCVSYHLPARPSWEEGQIRKAKAPGDNRRPSRRRPTRGEAAMAPETQRALRTPAPVALERMLKRNPRGAMARKTARNLRQGQMVLPEALQRRTVE